MHPDDRTGFDALLDQATGDPDVLGIILTGSRAHGFVSPWSDFDVRLIVGDEAESEPRARYAATAFANVDLNVMSFREFVSHAAWDSPSVWDRYSFVHAQILTDRTGAIRPLVEEKGRVPADQQASFSETALDGFINGVYRALKCHRKGNDLCVRLEAAEAVRYGLDVVFALEGRIRPYPVWLEYELRSFPLQSFAMTGSDLLRLVSSILAGSDVVALQQLLVAVLEQARSRGHAAVIDSWGSDIDWMIHYSVDAV